MSSEREINYSATVQATKDEIREYRSGEYGSHIRAIKAMRTRTGCGLQEAKRALESGHVGVSDFDRGRAAAYAEIVAMLRTDAAEDESRGLMISAQSLSDIADRIEARAKEQSQ